MYSITFQQMEAFLKVAEVLNITVVAESNYVSQAALSKMIQRLEESIGVKLFNRNTRGMTLTQEGRMFYNRTMVPFESICSAIEEIREITDHNKSIIKIGYPSTVNINVEYSNVTEIVSKYKSLHPEIAVEEHIYDAFLLKRMLSLGSIDLMFIQSFLNNASEGLELVPISRLSMCIAVSKNNPAIVNDKLNYNILSQQVLYTLNNPNENIDMERYVRNTEIRHSRLKSVPNFETLMFYVGHNLGYAFVGNIRTSNYENVRVFPVEDGAYTHDLCIAWKSENFSEAIRKFVSFFCKECNVDYII